MSVKVIFKEEYSEPIGPVTIYDQSKDKHRDDEQIGVPCGLSDEVLRKEYGLDKRGWLTQREAEKIAETLGVELEIV